MYDCSPIHCDVILLTWQDAMLKGLLKDAFLTEDERSILASVECQLNCHTRLAFYLHSNGNAHEMACRFFYRLTPM